MISLTPLYILPGNYCVGIWPGKLPHFSNIYCLYPWGSWVDLDGVVNFKMHLDAQTIAGLLEPFIKAFCVGYYDGNGFVVGITVAGVAMFVTINSLIDILIW